jgi:archaellum component FlaC
MKITAVILAGILIETRRKLDSERYVRLTAEESLEKANAQIRHLEEDLARLTSKMTGTEKLLEQTKDINTQLQERMDNAVAAQESMRQKIQILEQTSPSQDSSKTGPSLEAGAT